MQEGSSDSGTLDNVVEFLLMGGRSLPHVMMMLIPEAWEKDREITPDRRPSTSTTARSSSPGRPGLDRVHRRTLIGATLDRNGLRPRATA